jgi:hypothetical protein
LVGFLDGKLEGWVSAGALGLLHPVEDVIAISRSFVVQSFDAFWLDHGPASLSAQRSTISRIGRRWFLTDRP